MTKTKQRIVSAITAASLLAGSAGVTALAPLASAATGGPTVTLTTGSSTTAGATTTIPVTATFSGPVTGFTVGDIVLGGTASSSISGFTEVSSTTYNFNVHVTSTGTLTISVPADVAIAAPGNQPSNTLNITITSGTTTATSTPTISNVTVTNIGTSTATISWNTDVPATGTVWYGTTSSYGSNTQSTTTASTTQSVTLTNLSAGTLYHFTITAAGATSTGTTTDRTFTTLSNATTTPLAVTGIDAVKTTAIANNTFEDGWKWVMHLTVPDNENAFRIKFSDWFMSSSTSFPAGGNIRISSPQSSNASTTGSGLIPSGNNYTDWLYLTGDTNSSMPGRQIDVTIEVKIPFGTQPGAYTTTFTAQSWASTATSTATQ